jgi:hypothetical protein
MLLSEPVIMTEGELDPSRLTTASRTPSVPIIACRSKLARTQASITSTDSA